MKFLVLAIVLVLVVWLFFGRGRKPPQAPPKKPAAHGDGAAQAMIACAHCGVHLPQSEALADAAGRLFCSEAHRLGGPR